MEKFIIYIVFNLLWIGFIILFRRRIKTMNRFIYKIIISDQFNGQTERMKKIVYGIWFLGLAVMNIYIYFYFI